MSNFTVRIQLRNAASSDYDELHVAMQEAGFSKELAGKDIAGNVGVWALPDGEYDYSHATQSAQEVRDIAKSIADRIKSGSWVLVTESKSRSWTTKKIRTI